MDTSDKRELTKQPSGKTNCPQKVLDLIYGNVSKEEKTKELEEDMRAFERTNSRVVDRVSSGKATS